MLLNLLDSSLKVKNRTGKTELMAHYAINLEVLTYVN
jgi:hypothetical protein